MQKITIKKIAILAAVLLVSIIIIYNGCGSKSKQEYIFGKVTIGQVKKTVSVTGVLELNETRRILSPSSSIVQKVYVDFNTKVKKGQLLAKLDSSVIDESIVRKKMQLENMKLKLMAAKKDYAGKKKMFTENLISKQGMEQAEIQYKTSVFQHKNVLLDYKNLMQQKKMARIVSPIKGIILNKNVKPLNQYPKGHLFFIIAPSFKKMSLLISIDESDIGSVKKGQKILFSVTAFPDKKFTGNISQVRMNPVKSGGLVTYQAIALCNNDELLLKPGMTATATVEVSRRDRVLRINNEAFIVAPDGEEFDSNQKNLWKKSVGIMAGLPAKKIIVKTGIIGDSFTELKKGKIKSGDNVLLKIIEVRD